MSLICVSLIEPQINKMINYAKLAKIKGAQVVELRLDKLKNLSCATISKLRKEIAPPIIATIRHSCEDGGFKKNENLRLKLIKEIIENNYDYLDLELRTAKKYKNILEYAKARKQKTIISYHDFSKTPATQKICSYLNECAKLGTIAKVAFKVKSATDNFKILEASVKAKTAGLKYVAIGMGKLGTITRILAPVLNQEIIYTAIKKGRESAEGQIPIASLPPINLETKICGLVGKNIAHSLSPLIQNKAFEALNLNFRYLLFDIDKKDISRLVGILKAFGANFGGVNVTAPFKESVIQYLDEVDELAGKIKAVNTILNEDSKLIGYNTDYYGAYEALKKAGVRLPNTETLLIGAGGAARAIACLLSQNNAKVTIASRTLRKAEKVAEDFNLDCVELSKLKNLNRNFKLIINATPVYDKLIIPEKLIKPYSTVLELVYAPLETKLVRTASRKGAKIINGLEMLLYQGIKAFELFTNKKAPKKLMESVVLKVKK
ncbi:MAG: shikimate dehydrogenase [Candidatus Thermoplasmatota archaeon]